MIFISGIIAIFLGVVLVCCVGETHKETFNRGEVISAWLMFGGAAAVVVSLLMALAKVLP